MKTWQKFKRNVSKVLGEQYENVPDADIVFAYDTVKLVRVLDRRLGYIFCLAQLAVIAYVVLGVFIIEKQYLASEKSTGWVISKVMNPQLSHLGVNWDVYDRVTNPGEQGAVFIPTRVLITRGQTQGDFCESPVHNCSKPADCDIGNEELQKNECTATGRCLRRQWCPAEDPANLATTETHYLDINEVTIWFQTFVHFHAFNLDVSTTDEKEPRYYPHKKPNTFPLRDIVRMANIDPADCTENGALMLVNTLFKCDLDAHTCEMKVEGQNIDTMTGYNHVHSHVYWEDGVRKRDSYRMYGLRLLVLTTGLGERTSMSQILLQVSSAIALLGVAETVADFWLMYIVPERRHYREQKILQTEDFND